MPAMPAVSDLDTPTALQPWTALVLKDGVALGGLLWPQLQQALALVWSALPQGAVLSERQINERLLAVLAGPAVWLDTDHVELRRWLVDAGWLQRDGFGRAYRLRGLAELAPELHASAQALAALDTAAWVAAQRAAHAARRDARRRVWEMRRHTSAA